MPLPIAELYAEPRSPFLLRSLAPTARSLSRASQVTPITTRTSTGRRVSKATFRTSVSFKPTDDPFAAFTPVEETFDEDWHLVQAEEARKSHSSSEGHPVSSEGMASGRRAGTLGNRRASFLRSLWGPFSSSSSSHKKPHRSRSAAELSISRPMEHTPTPSIAPRNSVTAVVPVGEAEAATTAQSSSYPSGTNSLHQLPTAVSKRASLSNFFRRGSKKSREPVEPSDFGEIGLALTTDEVTSASVAGTATQQRGYATSLSAPLPVPRLRGAASWSVTGPVGRSRAANIATDAHHPPRPRTADSRLSSVSDAVPSLKTTRGHGKRAGFRRLSIFGLLPSFPPGAAPSTPTPGRPSSAGAPARSRSDSRASLRSISERNPASARPPRSVARPPSRSRLRPDSDTPASGPSIIDESLCTRDACDCLAAPVSFAGLRKQSSSFSVASEPVRRSAEWQSRLSSFRQQELSADEDARRSSDEESARLLASIECERRRLVAERERLATDLGAIIRGAEDRCIRLYESSLGRAGSASSLSMQERPTGAMSPSSRQFDLRDSIIEEGDGDSEEGDLQNADVLPETDPARAMLLACQETLDALSVRLALALRATNDGRNPDLLQNSCDISLATTPSRQSARSSDCTLVASANSRRIDARDASPARKTRTPLALFQPKALMLTPPGTPDEGQVSSSASSSVSRSHTRSSSTASFGGSSVLSCRARGSPVSSPATLRPAHRRAPSSAFSTASCRTWSAAESDDGSFVSCGEGSARSSSPASRAEAPVRNLLTLASADLGHDCASHVDLHSSPQLGRGRQPCCSINAPAVPLFTRAKSPRCPA